jgi:hypothetical protein
VYTIPQHRTPDGIICGYAGTLSMSGQCPTCGPPATFGNGAPLDIAAAEDAHRRMYPAAYAQAEQSDEDAAADMLAGARDALAEARRAAADAYAGVADAIHEYGARCQDVERARRELAAAEAGQAALARTQ